MIAYLAVVTVADTANQKLELFFIARGSHFDGIGDRFSDKYVLSFKSRWI